MSQPVEVSMRANLSSSVISKKTKAIGTIRSTASDPGDAVPTELDAIEGDWALAVVPTGHPAG